ncbi:S8 family serine peptidase [Bacteriovoracaceae bacterium]|nr:S8 family serine peptidase [Bacteriovoracaceae bacterium]
MNKYVKEYLNVILCSLTIVLISACGGGGGGGSTAPEVAPPSACTGGSKFTSNDPLAACSWHLENKGQKLFSTYKGTSGIDLNMNETASVLLIRGKDLKIAISDSGLEIAHEDLSSNVLANQSRNYITGSYTSGYIGDPTNTQSKSGDHGTSVAGIIAAVEGNNIGSLGVSSQAKIAGINYLSSNQSELFKVDQANGEFDIFNQSFGTVSTKNGNILKNYLSQLKYGATNLREGKGAIYVKSAGNNFAEGDCGNSDTHNSTPYIIVVPAVNADGLSSTYSESCACNLVAGFGGEDGSTRPAIVTTDQEGCENGYSRTDNESNLFEKGNSYNLNCNYSSTFNGTSSAAPMITGAVALILNANPNLTWRDVRHILISTARKIDSTIDDIKYPTVDVPEGYVWEQGWKTNTAGHSFHNWYGFGLVDIDASVKMALNYSVTLPTYIETIYEDTEEWIYENSNINEAIPDNNYPGLQNQITVLESDNLTIESVQVRLNVSHYHVGDIGVELVSPAGTKSILLNSNNLFGSSDHLLNMVLLSNAFYGEKSIGNWTLRLVDAKENDTGSLVSWGLKINGGSNTATQRNRYCGGKGTSANPYQICTDEQLSYLHLLPTKFFILNNDIDMTDLEWTMPDKFSGTFDGNNYTISNLAINSGTTSDASFVGTNDGTIKNITFTNVNFIGKNSAGIAITNEGTINFVTVSGHIESNSNSYPESTGGIAASNSSYPIGNIMNVTVNATIIGKDNTGGIVGKNYGTISKASYQGTLTGIDKVGGIAGYASKLSLTDDAGIIEKSHSSGTIRGIWGSYIGGIVGWQSSNAIIDQVYSNANITADNFNAGGIVGLNNGGIISNCYAISTVTSTNDSGGIVGDNYSNTSIVKNCFVKSNVTASSSKQGAISGSNLGTITSSYWDSDLSSVGGFSGGGVSKTTNQMRSETTFNGWDFSDVWSINDGASYPQLRY